MLRQFIAFTGVGAIGTTGHYLVLISLVALFQLPPTVATSIGFVVGALINYQLNYRYTFKSVVPHRVALPKFLLIATLGAAINLLIVYWGTHLFSIHYLVIQLVATTTVLLWNFFINRIWTYR